MNDLRKPALLPSDPRRVTSQARVALLALLLIAVAACASSAPSAAPSTSPSAAATATVAPVASASPAPSQDPAAIYDAIEQQVIAIRGLQPTRPVERQLIDEAELRTILTKLFDEQTPPAYLAAQERLYKALGLIPGDAVLRDLSLDLLSGGVAGFYRDEEGKLYVVSRSGGIGGNEKIAYAHEYGHALQDQTWSVFKDQRDVLDQGDRSLARAAVYEGDATILMSQWAVAHATPEDLQDVVAAGADPEQAALLERIPAIMKETLLFPYTTGATFVGSALGQGDLAAVDKLYSQMPESTEQIIHPEKYAAGEAPVTVDLPADLATRLGAGWTVPMQDTFGELQTGIWLREGGVDAEFAGDAAAGWGGDRMAVIEGPDDTWALAWHTVWDTPNDADGFEAAANTALTNAGGIGQVLPGTGGTSRWVLVASDADTMSRVANVLELAG